jgi:hypothetical protein
MAGSNIALAIPKISPGLQHFSPAINHFPLNISVVFPANRGGRSMADLAVVSPPAEDNHLMQLPSHMDEQGFQRRPGIGEGKHSTTPSENSSEKTQIFCDKSRFFLAQFGQKSQENCVT